MIAAQIVIYFIQIGDVDTDSFFNTTNNNNSSFEYFSREQPENSNFSVDSVSLYYSIASFTIFFTIYIFWYAMECIYKSSRNKLVKNPTWVNLDTEYKECCELLSLSRKIEHLIDNFDNAIEALNKNTVNFVKETRNRKILNIRQQEEEQRRTEEEQRRAEEEQRRTEEEEIKKLEEEIKSAEDKIKNEEDKVYESRQEEMKKRKEELSRKKQNVERRKGTSDRREGERKGLGNRRNYDD